MTVKNITFCFLHNSMELFTFMKKVSIILLLLIPASKMNILLQMPANKRDSEALCNKQVYFLNTVVYSGKSQGLFSST